LRKPRRTTPRTINSTKLHTSCSKSNTVKVIATCYNEAALLKSGTITLCWPLRALNATGKDVGQWCQMPRWLTTRCRSFDRSGGRVIRIEGQNFLCRSSDCWYSQPMSNYAFPSSSLENPLHYRSLLAFLSSSIPCSTHIFLQHQRPLFKHPGMALLPTSIGKVV
jgi:hypothetical protein